MEAPKSDWIMINTDKQDGNHDTLDTVGKIEGT